MLLMIGGHVVNTAVWAGAQTVEHEWPAPIAKDT